jgi:2-polyprenyl-3-methyl-5-hydroxy-6-metoxy-1,4-benzoquinol methylase
MQENNLSKEKLNSMAKGWVLSDGRAVQYILDNYRPDSTILDVGCGKGHFLATLSSHGYRNLSGIDIKDCLIFEDLKKNDVFQQVNVSFDRFPFSDNSQDLVVSIETFEHLENGFNFVRECARVLKPGGQLIISFPYGWSLQSRLKFLFKCNVIGYRKENSHINFMTKDIFEKCFGQAFVIESSFFYRGRISVFGKAVHLPANKFFGNAVCHTMRKKI